MLYRDILVIKGNYNSFERYYIDNLNKCGIRCESIFNSDSIFRKISNHAKLPFEYIWYNGWKHDLSSFENIVIFDSICNSNIVKFLKNKTKAKIIFWHWNPIKTKQDLKIYSETKFICEHWTFNELDAKKYSMNLSNQFFFIQKDNPTNKENKAFFVGADKGRYDVLLKLSSLFKTNGIKCDFHVVDANKKGMYYQKNFIEYLEVLKSVKNSKYLVEITQDGQNGLTARALEAMFCKTKLITNNKEIVNLPFYNKMNIFIYGKDNEEDFSLFIHSPFIEISKKHLYKFSAEGWIESLIKNF